MVESSTMVRILLLAMWNREKWYTEHLRMGKHVLVKGSMLASLLELDLFFGRSAPCC